MNQENNNLNNQFQSNNQMNNQSNNFNSVGNPAANQFMNQQQVSSANNNQQFNQTQSSGMQNSVANQFVQPQPTGMQNLATNQFVQSQPTGTINTTVNQPDKKKRNKKKLIIIFSIIVIIVLAVILIPLIVGKNANKYAANNKSGNLKFYVPTTWEYDEENKMYTSESGICAIVGGELKISYNEAISSFEQLYGKFNTVKNINGKEWNYNYISANGVEVYNYAIQDSLGDYIISFMKKSNIDEECNEYVNRLEKSMILGK